MEINCQKLRRQLFCQLLIKGKEGEESGDIEDQIGADYHLLLSLGEWFQ